MSVNKSPIIDLYNGSSIDIWMDDEDEIITLSIHGRITIALDKEDFQEIYNAVFISKQVIKEKEDSR